VGDRSRRRFPRRSREVQPAITTLRAGIYVRISEDQSGERIGVDQRQRPDCLSYCQARGWQVVEVFTFLVVACF
jgi:hypothetical protein